MGAKYSGRSQIRVISGSPASRGPQQISEGHKKGMFSFNTHRPFDAICSLAFEPVTVIMFLISSWWSGGMSTGAHFTPGVCILNISHLISPVDCLPVCNSSSNTKIWLRGWLCCSPRNCVPFRYTNVWVDLGLLIAPIGATVSGYPALGGWPVQGASLR